MNMYQHKITKTELNTLPPASFPGKIVIIDKTEQIASAINFLRQHDTVGIDTETRPSFAKGIRFSVALLQIATQEECFLFRLNKTGLTAEIAEFLSDKNIKKIGLALRDDFNALARRHRFTPANCIDLQTIVQQYGILDMGLQKIFGIVFGQRISKSQQLTNWENETLTEQQQRYAATDAWATLMIYKELEHMPRLSKEEIEELIQQQNPANP